MAQPDHTRRLAQTEEALIVLFCLIDDAYMLLNPHGSRRYESLKRLSDSEVIVLALFQQLRGVESERSFLRDAQRFFSHLFPGVVGFHPSSLHRRVRKLRRYLEPLRREVLYEMVGDPETLLVYSTLLSVLHPRQVPQGSGFPGDAWVRWGSFSVYGVKLHLICATNGVPLSYELTPASVADVSLTEELIAEAALGEGVARKLLGDLAYRSKELREALAEVGILLITEPSERRRGVRQRIEIAISSLKRVFGLGETLATTLVGPWLPGSQPREQPTPTPSRSTVCWDALKVTSRSCGHEPDNRHLGSPARARRTNRRGKSMRKTILDRAAVVTSRGRRPFVAALAGATLIIGLLLSAGANEARAQEAFTCDRVASLQGNDANPGTQAAPVRSIAKLTSMLNPGQTGCLAAGQTFHELVTINNSGEAGKSITLRSTAGGRANFTGQMMVSGNHVVVTDLNFRGIGDIANTYPKTYHLGIDGDHVKVANNDITTPHGICVDVGGLDAFGAPNQEGVRADNLVLDGNRIHGCGSSNQLGADDSGVHGVYVVNSLNAKITNNYVYDNKVRGIQLWPKAEGTLIEYNVLDGNSGNLNIGSWSPNGYFSRNTTVRNNIISNSTFAFSKDSHQVFGNFPNDGQTYGNVVTGNCIIHQDSSKNFGGYGYAQTNNLFADPLYENRTTKDFDLRAGSPCASKGPHAAIPEPPSEDDTAPAITQVRPANGATTRDRTPTIVATVRDAQSELLESDLRLFIDGREIGIDDRGYDQSTDQLFHAPEDFRLSFGLHKAQVIATDAQGLSASKQWSFKVIR